MNYLISLLIVIFISMGSSANGQAKVTRLVGEQIKEDLGKKATLICIPVKIIKTMEIVAVSGENSGFWIQKESETIYKFIDIEKAIGVKLKPGTYYVYPYFRPKEVKAKVIVSLR